jgi:hypothetical protein
LLLLLFEEIGYSWSAIGLEGGVRIEAGCFHVR